MLLMTTMRQAARNPLHLVLALAVLACAACDRAPSASVPAAEATAKEVAPTIAIQYPTLTPELAALDQAMHAYADATKKAFDAALAAHKDLVGPPPHLNLEFDIATRTQDFVSALASGETDIGDAHPSTLQATFTQHLPSGKIVALSDLFVDPAAAVQALSAEAAHRLEAEGEARLRSEHLADAVVADRLKTLRNMVEQGTQPEAQNFSRFLIDGVDGKAIGLSLQFPPGQVAAVAQGAQQLEVPARIFYAMLKPEYQDAFAVDKEDLRGASAWAEPR